MAADPIAAPTRPRAPQRPRLRPAPPPRRVSGPASSRARTAPRAGTVALPSPGLGRLLDVLRGLPDARWLDRLLRGNGWIMLIGGALIGIVAMQVTLLEMNAGIGQSLEKAGTLERQNADLRSEVSRLSSEERIASVAGGLGLVMPDAGQVRYVHVRGERDARKAASVMRAPDPIDELAATTGAATATAPAAGTTATTDPATGTTAAPAAAGGTPAPTTGTPTAAPGQ